MALKLRFYPRHIPVKRDFLFKHFVQMGDFNGPRGKITDKNRQSRGKMIAGSILSKVG